MAQSRIGRWRAAQSSAIRTRLPGNVDTVTMGEQARDADDALGAIPRMQLVEVNGQPYQPPFVVTFPVRPRMVLCQMMQAGDQGAAVSGNAQPTWRWNNGGAEITFVSGLTAGPVLYNWVFLGVG